VVFLQHGFLCSSADWLVGPRSAALGFILADAGYDVWLGNFRGNTYSRRHLTLDPELKEFWRFSFDEHGQQDLPAMLDHVLAITGRQRLIYIGHSMGTLAFWIMMNVRPEMNAKVELMVGLAPAAAPVLHPANPLGQTVWANPLGAMLIKKVTPA
jgi:lysosomal acid lipase/cholesteryl ester hydrolase